MQLLIKFYDTCFNLFKRRNLLFNIFPVNPMSSKSLNFSFKCQPWMKIEPSEYVLTYYCEIRGLYFKTYYGRILWFFVISLSSQVQCLRARPGPTQLKHLSGAPLQGRPLALPTNIRLGWKSLQRTNTPAYYENL